MLKKTITFTDYNGAERKEDFYFNLSEAECLEMEMSVQGGLIEKINRIIAAQDNPSLFALFKDLVLRAYGEKSADGRKFLKEDENGRRLADDFKQTEAYSILIMELATNAELASDFVNGIIPKKVSVDKPALAPVK